jgi:phosphosulfolactate phosphohydrolase-like enzyme
MVRDFQALLESPGWARLNKVVAEQLEARIQQVMLVPAGSGDRHPISDLLGAEYMKGEYNGQVSVMSLPKTQIEMLQQYLQSTQEETEDGPGTGNTSSP